MNKFISFSPKVIRRFDWNIDWVPEKNRYWVESSTWNSLHYGHIISRAHDIDTPWSLCGTVCEIPTNLDGVEDDFSDMLDSVAVDTINKIQQKNQAPYIFYSGGIDSTSIFVALLRNADRNFLESLTVVSNHDSIQENPYFFDRFIKNKFRIIETDKFLIDPEHAHEIAIIDGESGNQCLGSGEIYDLARKNRTDLLDRHYSITEQFDYQPNDRFFVNLALDSVKYAPVRIHSLYDFFWWSNFNFKFDHVLLRKILVYTDNFLGDQRRTFFYNNLYRLYAHADMQKWCMCNLEQMRATLNTTTKFHPKKYIFDYDKNEYYFLQKKESSSSAIIFSNKDTYKKLYIGLDADWNIVDFTDRKTRQMIKKIILEN
jgi:hypothetical protein